MDCVGIHGPLDVFSASQVPTTSKSCVPPCGGLVNEVLLMMEGGSRIVNCHVNQGGWKRSHYEVHIQAQDTITFAFVDAHWKI
jgi:hypothetical protein